MKQSRSLKKPQGICILTRVGVSKPYLSRWQRLKPYKTILMYFTTVPWALEVSICQCWANRSGLTVILLTTLSLHSSTLPSPSLLLVKWVYSQQPAPGNSFAPCSSTVKNLTHLARDEKFIIRKAKTTCCCILCIKVFMWGEVFLPTSRHLL